MTDTIFLCASKDNIKKIYPSIYPDYPYYSPDDILPDGMPGVKTIFSTWGMPSYDKEDIRRLFPDLQCV